MIILPAGLAVWLALLVVGGLAGAPLTIGLFASLPFGTTAFATLTALGGSSPLIYTLFTLAILGAVALRGRVLVELGLAFGQFRTAWLATALALYAACGSYILPRLFADATTAFIPFEGVVREVPLGPSSGNITQTAYFLLGVLLFIAFCAILLRAENLEKMRRGFFAFVIAHVALGWLDFGGKLAGMGDILDPVRTASYALLTEIGQSGFWRIVGGYSEASTFATYGLAAVAFSFTYWREAGSRLALLLTVALVPLLILSTSSTAYVGCAALSLLLLLSIGKAAFRDRLKSEELYLMVGLLAVLAVMLGLYLYDPSPFEPFFDLLHAMVFDKASTESGKERAYWNLRSLEAFLDTYGLGVGFGSSRSSSWAVSVVSQLGVIGTLMMALLIGSLLRGMGGLRPAPGEKALFALCAGARASAVAFLVAGTIGGGNADPGVLFFGALATVLACRHHVVTQRQAARLQLASSSAHLIVGPLSGNGTALA